MKKKSKRKKDVDDDDVDDNQLVVAFSPVNNKGLHQG